MRKNCSWRWPDARRECCSWMRAAIGIAAKVYLAVRGLTGRERGEGREVLEEMMRLRMCIVEGVRVKVEARARKRALN